MVVKSKETGLWFPIMLVFGFFLAVLLVMPGIVRAQVEVEMTAEDLVSLEAYNASLTSVLQILTEKSGLNIVTGPNVEEKTLSIRIEDISLDEAIDMVVRASGFTYERIGNSVLIETREVLGDDANVTSFVVQLEHADALEVQDMLRDLSKFVQVDMSGNRLVVQSSPKMKGEILDVIDQVDQPALQVMLEAKLMEVSVDDLMELGIDWNKINSFTTILAEGDFVDPSRTNNLPDEMPYERTKFFRWDSLKWNRQLEALEIVLIQEGSAKILANTKLATMNNRQADIHIGDIVPYVVTSFAAGTGGVTEMVTIEREKVGIKLRIVPKVNEDGYITTRVEPEVSSIIGWRGPNNEIPWVKTRTASTVVRVKDGEKIVIAGLLNEDESIQVTKLPILGHIPVLGNLFQHSATNRKKTDLIIEITPQIIKD
jgi:type II secretory pathway component GspD/PulD (secretin)